MLKSKKSGIILILIGTFIPIVCYPFLTQDTRDLQVIDTLKEHIPYIVRIRGLNLILKEGYFLPMTEEQELAALNIPPPPKGFTLDKPKEIDTQKGTILLPVKEGGIN